MMMAMMREEEKHDNNTITDGGSTDPSTVSVDITPNTRPFKNVSLPFIRVIPRNVWRAKR